MFQPAFLVGVLFGRWHFGTDPLAVGARGRRLGSLAMVALVDDGVAQLSSSQEEEAQTPVDLIAALNYPVAVAARKHRLRPSLRKDDHGLGVRIWRETLQSRRVKDGRRNNTLGAGHWALGLSAIVYGGWG